MSYERNTIFNPLSTDEFVRRETHRVSTNAFIQDVDRKLLEITETPPSKEFDELFALCASVAHERHLQGLCYLVEGLNDNSSSLITINIDRPEGIAPEPVGPTIGIDEDERIDANKLGKQDATRDLMRILAPSENDLLRTLSPIDTFSQNVLGMYENPWKKEFLRKVDFEPFSEFTEGLKHYQGGIMTLTLRTRLPTLNYSLVYAPGSQYPSRHLYATDKI